MSDFNIDNYISNLAYINKDFNSIWDEIMEVVPKLTSKWNPGEANESDPLVVLLKELGIISDKLNYNIDKNILESFPDTLTQLRAAYSVFASMGYTPRWYRSALTEATIIYDGGAGETTYTTFGDTSITATLPLFTEVCDENSESVYTLLKSVKLEPGKVSSTAVPAMEGTINDFEVNGSTLIDVDCLDSNNRLYFVQPNVAQNGIFISFDPDFGDVDGVNESDTYNSQQLYSEVAPTTTWRRVTNLHQQLPGQYCYQFGLDTVTGSCYIQFPDDIGTIIGNGVYIKYLLSSGESGNIAKNTLDSFLVSPSVSFSFISEGEESSYTIGDTNLQVSNSSGATNGKDPETIAEMQAAYKRVVGTFDTLVTVNDYENYLYNLENDYGQPQVSNIRVGDRTNDLYASYKIKKLNKAGQVTTSVAVTPTEDGGETLNAFQLRLYPLRSGGTSITTEAQFNQSFSTPVGDGEDSATPGSLMSTLVNEVEDAKCILHDYLPEAGAPIFLDYYLSGQIYLQRALTSKEAEAVRDAVISNLHEHLNARQLTYGQKVDYQQVVDWIKESDPRIQYAALDPIQYYLNTEDLAYKAFVENCGNLDIQKRSVLAGVTPWTTFKDLTYYWGASDYGEFDKSSVVGEGTLGTIASIAPQVSLTIVKDVISGEGAVVRANETLHILVPEYLATTTYTNYLYAVVELTSSIPAGTPHKLGVGEKIYIFEERPDAKICETPASAASTAKAILGEGKIIRANVELGGKKESNEKYPNNTAINLSSSITISIVERDTSTLQSTYATSSTTYRQGLKVATNSKGLVAMLGAAEAGTYTLNIGEYLLWTNNVTPVLEIGSVGEGNTIVKKNGGKIIMPLLEANYEENSDSISWTEIDNGALSYKANTIYSFGEGYRVQLLPQTGTALSLGDVDTLQVINLPGCNKVQYKLQSDEGSEFESLPAILDPDEDPYRCSWCLSLAVSPDQPQKLEEGQDIVVTGTATGSSSSVPSITISADSNSTLYLGASKAILTPGGSALQLSASEAEGLTLQSFCSEEDPVSTTYFRSVDLEKTTLPSIKGYYIFPALFEGIDIVQYVLAAKNVKLANIKLDGKGLAQVGPISAVGLNATYWTGTEQNSIANICPGDYVILNSDYLYADGGMPIYEPSSDSLIEDPWKPESFFNVAHVCNRYVLPRLHSVIVEGTKIEALERLKISPLSIKEN